MNSGKVLIAAPVHEVLTKGLQSEGYEMVHEEKITQERAFELIGDCVGVITSTRLQLDKALLEAAPQLKWIGRMGSGMEVIDVEYATLKGVACYSSPEGNSNAVAEHAMGMLLSLNKRIAWSYQEVKGGKWLRDANRGVELEGKTIGIIGFGHTGRAFAKKLAGFDVKVMAYDKYNREGFPEHILNCGDLSPIFEQADIVSFHVPLRDETHHYFNRSFLTQMHKAFVLINSSRGNIVDTLVMYEGLKTGKLAGVCLDVVEEEPLENMSNEVRSILNEIMQKPEVLVTPHIAGYSHEALFKMSSILLRKIVTGA